MKTSTLFEKLTCILFCGFIGVMGILYLALPRQDFSEVEKRYLEENPQLTYENLISGQFGTDLEDYMADHMPGRNFFVGLGAYYDLLMGRQSSKDIYRAEDGRLVERPTVWNQEQAEKNMKYINRFADNVGISVDLILVPSAGYILQDQIKGIHDEYTDDAIIDSIYALAGENVVCYDLISVYQNLSSDAQLYYRTDHHWTSYGAYKAYEMYMQCQQRSYRSAGDFTVESHSGFRGSVYSRSGLWLTPAEEIQLWYGSDLTVQTQDGSYTSPFFRDRLEEADMYTVFLDGNQPIVRIRNENNAGQGKLLVIRDSYANCIGPMLAESYEEVVMVDLRYYTGSLSLLQEQEQFTNILVMYSIGNFMTDGNFPKIR